ARTAVASSVEVTSPGYAGARHPAPSHPAGVRSRRGPCETRAVDDRVLAIIAILLGVLIGVVLLVPFVALSYRRRGGLTVGRAALWFAGLVYFCAIWTYTLLPLPDPDTIRCAGVNLDIFAF